LPDEHQCASRARFTSAIRRLSNLRICCQAGVRPADTILDFGFSILDSRLENGAL